MTFRPPEATVANPPHTNFTPPSLATHVPANVVRFGDCLRSHHNIVKNLVRCLVTKFCYTDGLTNPLRIQGPMTNRAHATK